MESGGASSVIGESATLGPLYSVFQRYYITDYACPPTTQQLTEEELTEYNALDPRNRFQDVLQRNAT